MGRKGWVPEGLLSDLSALRDGDGAAAEDLNSWFLSWSGFELHSRAIVGSTAKVGWVMDIPHDCYLEEGFLSELDSRLRWMTAVQTSLNDWLGSGRPTLLYSFGQTCWGGLLGGPPEEPSDEASIPSFAVVVSAVILLSLVYQYLTGNVNRGGSKAYSRSSLDFRDVYVATVLFLGAYVWIKFREVAGLRGVHPRTLVDKHGATKKVYEARLKPPLWNGKKVPRLDLGRFATPQEAHNKFLIAAFYYNRGAGWLDGWFQMPPMSEDEQSLAGLEKMKWVISQAKKVYEDFKKKAEVLAALQRELSELCQGQATPRHDEVNVDPCGASLLNLAGHQQPALASQVESSGMSMGMVGLGHGLECASCSFDGTHEGLALPYGHSLGSQEGYALPVHQLPPNTKCLNGSNQLDLLQTRVSTQPQQISCQQNQISDPQQQIFLLQKQIQGLVAQILQLQCQQRI